MPFLFNETLRIWFVEYYPAVVYERSSFFLAHELGYSNNNRTIQKPSGPNAIPVKQKTADKKGGVKTSC